MDRTVVLRFPPAALAVGYLPVFAILLLVGLQSAVPIDDLTRDVNAIARLPWYVGAISNLGILIWMSAAAIALFVGLATRGTVSDTDRARLLWSSGAISAWLAADDLFQLHEDVLPGLFATSESFVVAGYLGLCMVWCFGNRRALLASEVLPLVLATACFGVSAALDLIPTDALPGLWRVQDCLIEDGAKLLGIVGWAVYLARLSALQIQGLGAGALR